MMKSKRRWLLLLPLLSLFAWAYQAASWRPKLVGVQPAPPIGLNRIMVEPPLGEPILISPDGKWLASAGRDARFCSLTLWDLASRRSVWQEQSQKHEYMRPLAFAPDGRTLIVAKSAARSSVLTVFRLEPETGKQLGQTDLPTAFQGFRSAALLPPHKLVISASGGVFIVDTQNGQVVRKWFFDPKIFLRNSKPSSPAQSHVSADGTTVIALKRGLNQTAVVLYDAATGKQRGTWIFKGVFRNPNLSPDGKLWVMTRPDKQSVFGDVYDATNGQKLWGPMLSSPGSPWIWSADGQKIIFQTTLGKSVWMVDARTAGHAKSVANSPNNQALALAPNGDTLYTLDNTGKIWRWRAR